MGHKVKVAQSCLTVCDPMDYIVPGILQVKILEWVAILSFLGNLPKPGTEPRFPALQADCLPAELPGKPIMYPQISIFGSWCFPRVPPLKRQ